MKYLLAIAIGTIILTLPVVAKHNIPNLNSIHHCMVDPVNDPCTPMCYSGARGAGNYELAQRILDYYAPGEKVEEVSK
jgi:hypothetical protein